MNTSSIDKEDKGSVDSCPGGKKQSIPEEPIISEGCTSSKDSDEVKRPKSGQQKIDNYFSTENKNDKTSSNSNNQSPKRAKMDIDSNTGPNSNTFEQSLTDDEDNENDPDQRRSGPITRSLASLSKLRTSFDDSDDDSRFSSWAQRDIAEYRNNYPNARSNSRVKDNYDFYTNKIPSHPDGDYIDNIHKKWFGDYRRLEIHHGYIQWLFPLQEQGLNWSAEPLQKHEIEKIKKDKTALERILKSYELMLDFYGFELVNEKTGEIRRLPDDSYKARFRNLNTSSHNYLRITRILKCLGEFDYEYLKFPFLEKILYESIIENTLPNCLRSCKDYWIETLRSQNERHAIRTYARELIEYRNKGLSPPKAHRAIRPSSQSSTRQKIKDMSISSNKKSYDSD